MSFITINDSTQVIPEKKDQDFVAHGKLNNGDLWYVVFDGHGKSTVINEIKELDYCSIMNAKRPFEIIEQKVDELGDTFNSGTTLAMVIVSIKTIKCYWRGDSTIKIWENGNLIFESKDHNRHNTSEMKRIESMGIETEYVNCPKIIDENTITVVQEPYFIVEKKISTDKDYFSPRYDKVNMTNCLGHNGKTGGFTCINRTNMKCDREYCVIAASDGLWDVMAPGENLSTFHNALDVAQHARKRWRQSWNYVYPGYDPIITTMPEGDDIGVAMWKGKISEI